jgi:hypothetical protein
MCRGGLISGILLATTIGLVGCVDADSTPPSTSPSPVAMAGATAAGSGGARAPAGGTSGAAGSSMMAAAGRPPTAMGTAGSGPSGTGGAAAGSGAGAGGRAGGAGGAAGGAGGAAGGAAGGGGGMMAAGPTFTEIYMSVLMPMCAGCHGALQPIMNTKDAAFMNLTTGMGSGMCSMNDRVAAGMPDMSVLVMALKGEGCRMGRPMPPAGGMVSADNIAKVEAWIMAGAMNN